MKYASSPSQDNTTKIRRIAQVAASALAIALASLGLAGCEHLDEPGGPKVAGWSLIDASERHPIVVSQQPHTMQLRIAAGTHSLSPQQRGEVLAFTDRSRVSDAGNSRLVIAAPSGSANETAAMYAVSEIRQLLGDNGFPESSISVEAYHAGERRDAPVRVSYLRYVAEAPTCGNWPSNLAHDPNNLPYTNFGCASQHNLAVMIANPADLIGPRTETDRPGERRGATWEKYVKGEATGAERSGDEKAKSDSK